MKSELEKTKEALDAAMEHLNANQGVITEHIRCLARINAILNPAPIMEDVEEIVGWVNVYQLKDGSIFPRNEVFMREADANREAVQNRISCQPIKVTVQREVKAPVERTGKLTLYDDGSYCLNCTSRVAVDLEGTFTWTE
jgi:hypothetical protein